MSGPKISAAEIEAQHKAQLERERQERLRRLREAQNRYNASRTNVTDLRNQLCILLNDNIGIISDVSASGGETLTIKINQLMTLMDMSPVDNTASEEAWTESAIKSQERAVKLFEEGKAIIEEEANRVGVYNAKVVGSAQHISVSNAVEKTIRESAEEQHGIFFSPISQDGIENNLESCLKELNELLEEKQSPMLKSVSAFIKEVKDVLSKKVNSREKDFKRMAQDIINREQDLIDAIEECKTLYSEYCAVAAINSVEPMELVSFSGAEMLEQEIHDLNCRYQRKDEMDFIADQVNQVMLELGYEFVSSHVLQQESEKDVSVYGADEETGIVVFTGENGEVMMQVVSLGDTDELSEEEIEESLDLQLSFCASHQDIVEELKNKGVLLRQVNYQPPRREHAKKICTSEFSSESRRTVTRRKRRYESRKAMRKV